MDEKPPLRDIYKELFPLATSISTFLGIPKHILDKINHDKEGADDRLQEMLSEWLKQVNPPPTWKQLADEVETIDPTKAQEIMRKHVN